MAKEKNKQQPPSAAKPAGNIPTVTDSPGIDRPPSSGGTAGPTTSVIPAVPNVDVIGTVGAAGVVGGVDRTSYPGIGGDRPGVPTNQHAYDIQSSTERVDTSYMSEQSDSPKATFVVSSPIEMDGERYEIGDEIELSEKDHQVLAHAVRQRSPWDKESPSKTKEERKAGAGSPAPTESDDQRREREERERREREQSGT